MYYIRKIRNSVLVYSDLIIILKVNNGNPAMGFESTNPHFIIKMETQWKKEFGKLNIVNVDF